jgi:hypothetical protein
MSEVKITIEGEGLSLTKHTTLQKAGQIISFLGYDNAQQEGAAPTSMNPVLLGRKMQPKDIIIESNAKTYPQKITAIGRYIHEQLGQKTFTLQELRIVFKKMGDEPTNFVHDLNKAVELQYIICVDATKEEYELTDKGNEAIEKGFIGEMTKKSLGTKRTVVSKGTRDEVNALHTVSTLDGYPDYHNLPTKGDKILWLLEYALKNNIKELTPAEVDSLSTKLRDQVEQSGFTALNARNMKKGYVLKNKDGFQIQKRGTDYLIGLVSSLPEEKKGE